MITFCRAFSVALVLSLISIHRVALAGRYVPTYGGNGHAQFANGTVVNYGVTSGSYGIEATGTGPISCSGYIDVTFTFTPDYVGEAPPPAVVLRESASAGWSGFSGSCNDSFGDPETYTSATGTSPASGTSGGVRYLLISNPGANFVRTSYPYANATSEGGQIAMSAKNSQVLAAAGSGGGGGQPPAQQLCTVNVWYSGVAYTPRVILANVTHSAGEEDILCGTPTTANVVWDTASSRGVSLPAALTVTDFSWSIPGALFSDWLADQTQATYINVIDGHSPGPSWCWIHGPGTEYTTAADNHTTSNITATFTVKTATSTLGSCTTPAYAVEVWQPWVHVDTYPGISAWDSGTTASSGGIHARGVRIIGDGMGIHARVGTPNRFVTQQYGCGRDAYAQRVLTDCHWVYSYLHVWKNDANGFYELDTVGDDTNWFYQGSGTPLIQDGQGSDIGLADAPGIGFPSSGIQSFNLNFTLEDTLMYQPPGQAARWVPLWAFQWKYQTLLSSLPLPSTAPGAVTKGAFEGASSAHPVWTSRHIAPSE